MLESLLKGISNMPKESKKTPDRGLIVIILLISIFGLLMIWSASMYEATLDGNEYSYVVKQAVFLVAGTIIMMLVSMVEYDVFRKWADALMAVTLVLLASTLLFGSSAGGAERWLRIGPITIQPSELAKITVMIFLSKYAEKMKNELKDIKTFGILLLFLALTCGLIYKQPALSTTVIVAGLIIIMYFMAGGRIAYIFAMAGLGSVAVYFLITKTNWRMDRISAYLDPWSDLMDSGWQPAQSLMALASGGLFGQGIGSGRAKLLFLPEAQNDYIFAIIGEELGLVGCVSVIAAYLFLIFRVVNIALHCPDMFSRMFCAAMALLISMQVFLNIAVVTNLIPSTGVMLPFISSGGSSLVTLMFAFGIVINISRHQVYNTPNSAVRRRG